ncbi:MAG: 2-oxoacid:acceptor oxidoreductase subunit alpha [Caldilineaceae bacterium]|nr:2-oxoacid:acceptor oxidoreductase subunit alpha [Caldilineaceae bacterium]
MSVAVREEPTLQQVASATVNDFVINVATANGSGSQTSNGVLLRALFKMGIPINGKNLFPSNIQGLPTWYIIRLSKEGYLGRREMTDVQVCMNGRTVTEDMERTVAGGVILYDDSLPIANRRKDVTYYGMPVKELVKAAKLPHALRDYVANMVYVGALTELLGIDAAEVEAALDHHFAGKASAVRLNMDMVEHAIDWAREHVEPHDVYRVERMSGFNEGKILVDGNTAGALGALAGGLSLASWYPITPSSSLAESVEKYADELRSDPETGKSTVAVVQAEDEMAAIGMVVGAGWTGARAMTCTSGPGISLMAEFAGLAYFAEVPAVIWDIQRMGPSTGLPTRTSQGDIHAAYYLSHGDTRHVVLFPANPAECFEFGRVSFDLAEELQTLVIVLSDLDLGMNAHISEPFEYSVEPFKRGKVLSAQDLEERQGVWARYMDVDGDGITYRTLPGTKHNMAAYFTRGTGHNEYGYYSERPDDWEENLLRLRRKLETARGLVPEPVVDDSDDAGIGIISLGSNHDGIEEARDRLAGEGVTTAYLRLRALPIGDAVRDFIDRYSTICVIEANGDGQLHSILTTEEPRQAMKLKSIAKCDGLPLSARFIVDEVLKVAQEVQQ